MRTSRLLLLAGLVVVFVPAVAAAQTAIAGVVRDASGGVLPGVTVEAASPALIDKVRTTVSNETGQYRIVDLRPGIYTVTFSLTGFSTVKREGLELTANFTAPLNVEMRVGAIEETITVTGEAPVVDVQSATQQQSLKREVLDSLPTGRNMPAIGKLMPGIVSSHEVGGSEGMQTPGMSVHGSSQVNYQIDGMTLQSPIGNGTAAMYWNDGQFQELTYQTSGIPAEVALGGVRIMMTPKDGGNNFSGMALGQLGTIQSNNFTDELKSRGLEQPDAMLEAWDQNASLGGPVLRDKLWFFLTQRYWGVNQLIANSGYHPSTRHLCTDVDWGTSTRERKLDCQGIDDNYINNGMLRLTSQVTAKNRVSAFYSKENKYRGHRELEPGISPEATTQQIMNLSYGFQIKWTAPITGRILWDAGVSQYFLNYDFDYQDPVGPNDRAHVDRVREQTWGARPAGFFNRNDYKRYHYATLAFVTGSHQLKTGLQYNYSIENSAYDRYLGHVVQEYNEGRPVSVLVDTTPVQNRPRLDDELGLFIQDSWTIKRLTLNPGIRWDYIKFSIDAQAGPAGRWVPARQFAAITNLPSFEEWSPRFSAGYDLFGNGKTAIKGSIGKFLASMGHGFPDTYNPFFVDTDRRTWDDRNNNDIAEDNEIGPPQKSNFGIKAPRRPGDNLKRQGDWEYTASIQQELLPGLSGSFAYIHRTFINVQSGSAGVPASVSQLNTFVSLSDYTPLQIPDPRGNGEQLTIYNLAASKQGLTDIVDVTVDTNRRYWDGIEFTGNGRLGGGRVVYGGLTIGGASQKLCEVFDPNALRYCERSEPWRPQIKFGGATPLPYGLQFSGTFVSFPGNQLGVSYIVDRNIVTAATGRRLTQTTITVPLDDPSRPDRYLDRTKQIDLRLSKIFRLGGSKRLNANLDIFNALNANTVLSEVTTFGSRLQVATSQLPGRLVQFGAQFFF
jgi:carboxypeptidase family protein